MHRHSTTVDSDFYRLSADDGPVWWLRGDPRCEPAWHPIEPEGAVRDDRRRFELYRKERRVGASATAHTTHTDLHFVRVQRVMRVSAGLWDKLAFGVPSLYRRWSLKGA
jgi:hypothetical protein